MRAMAPDGLSDLLACVAAVGSSLGQSFDPTGVLAEFSARTQPVVPHDYMLIAVREDDGHTYSVFAEYAVRGSVSCDNKRYTTAFERGGRAAMDSFALAPVFGGDAERVANMASDDRLGEASACRATLDELGLRSRLAVPLCAGGHVRGALIIMSATVGLYTEAHALACRQVSDLIGPFVHAALALHRDPRPRERLAAATALAPILGASLKVGDVLERLGEAIRPLIDFDTMGLALRAADGPGFERSGIIGVRRPGYATTPAVEDYSTLERVSRGEIILVRDARRELDPGRAGDRYLIESGDRSVLGVPLLFGEESGGGLFFVTAREHWYDESDVEVGTAIAAALVLAVQHQRLAEHQQRLGVVEAKAQKLERQVASLRTALDHRFGFDAIIGRAPKFIAAVDDARKVAPTGTTVSAARRRWRPTSVSLRPPIATLNVPWPMAGSARIFTTDLRCFASICRPCANGATMSCSSLITSCVSWAVRWASQTPASATRRAICSRCTRGPATSASCRTPSSGRSSSPRVS